MRAVQLIAPNEVQMIDRAEAHSTGPDGTGATIGIETVGICGTDVGIVAGKIPARLPVVLGHEAVGAIEEAAPGGQLEVGQRVLIDPGVSCNTCDLCQRDLNHLCRNGGLLGREIDGVFADRLIVPETHLIPVPDHISGDAAGLLQVLGTCVHALDTVDDIIEANRGGHVVVLGLGVGGQLIAQMLTARGMKVIGITRSEGNRKLASDLGAVATVAPAEAAEAVADMTDGRGADLVVEAVGSESTYASAIELAGYASTIVLYGTAGSGGSGLPYYLLYFKELTLVCPRAARLPDYHKAVELVANGSVKAEPLVSARFSLDEAEAAIGAVKSSGTLKVLLNV